MSGAGANGESAASGCACTTAAGGPGSSSPTLLGLLLGLAALRVRGRRL